MKRIFFIFISCIILALQCSCSDNNSKNIMPPIVFSFNQYNPSNPIPYDSWIIDCAGNVYHSNNTSPNLNQNIPSDYKKIDTINQSIINNQYKIVQQIISCNDYEITPFEIDDPVPNINPGYKEWTAQGYNQNNELVTIILYKEDFYPYYSNNPYSRGLSDWITDVISKYDDFMPIYYIY